MTRTPFLIRQRSFSRFFYFLIVLELVIYFEGVFFFGWTGGGGEVSADTVLYMIEFQSL